MSKISYSPPTPQELKNFGLTVGGIFFFLGTVFLVFFQFVNGKHPIKAAVFLSVGTFLILMASIPPLRSSGLMIGLHKGWIHLAMFLAKYVGHYVGIAIFSALFFLIFMPVSGIARILGFDPLGLRKHGQVDSYWHPRKAALTSDHYEKQFPMEKSHDES